MIGPEDIGRREKIAIAIAAPIVHGLVYGLANRFPLGPPGQLPMTAVDRWVPFIPETVWLYLSDYALLLFAFLVCRDTLRFTASFLAVIAASTLVQWLVPIEYPRDLYPLGPGGGLSEWAVGQLRVFDAPTSCFPSLHVGVAAIGALSVMRAPSLRAPRLFTAVVVVWAALVCISTVTVKQHYLVDVAGGLAVALAVHLFHDRAVTLISAGARAARQRPA